MIAYHGSIKRCLKELKPFTKKGATIDNPCVYMSTDEALSALYIWDKPYYWFTYGFTDEGIVEYTEYFPDSLKYFYSGLSGSIYTLDGNFEAASQTGIRSLVVSKESVPVIKEKVITDAFDYILKLESLGKIKIVRFHEADEKRLKQYYAIVKAAKDTPDCGTEEMKFLMEKFPEI